MAIGNYSNIRAVRRSVAVAWDDDLLKEINEMARMSNTSFAAVARTLCRAAIEERKKEQRA